MGKVLLLKLLTSIGLIDSLYLTLEHFRNASVGCGIVFSDCNAVLGSSYSEVFGIPLALFGFFHYLLLLLSFYLLKKKLARLYSLVFSGVGLLLSTYFVYLQLFVIGAICVYCMASATTSLAIFLLTLSIYWKERKVLLLNLLKIIYKHLVKPILFLIDAEKVHVHMVLLGERLGRSGMAKQFLKKLFRKKSRILRQRIEGVVFELPVGLAAGFDYEARLTQVLPSLGFGFGTVGTITNSSYEGNKRPRLGRLPKSKSLMVNKGFKNLGALETSKKMERLEFEYPVGVSIGRTNSRSLKTQRMSVEDVLEAFKKFEDSGVKSSYYELNISCPNLYGKISFYPIKNLRELLREVEKLKIKKPIFMKMPIDITNRQALLMLKEISKYKTIKGVIFGNLQKDRKNKELHREEVKRFNVGHFSGKPTFKRSNELIGLTYKNYKDRFVIIGCGGVFNAKDAYEKIKMGASLIQMITGMIYEGPQIVTEINSELELFVKKDGYSSISKAVGKNTQSN